MNVPLLFTDVLYHGEFRLSSVFFDFFAVCEKNFWGMRISDDEGAELKRKLSFRKKFIFGKTQSLTGYLWLKVI